MRKLFILTSFFTITPCLLIFSIILLSLFIFEKNPGQGNLLSQSIKNVSYTALPVTNNAIIDTIKAEDGRIAKLQQFFTKYHSPLLPHAQLIVELADTYGLDYRTIPAIAMQESTGCKRIPIDSHNCWGWGIYGSKVTRFPDYPTAIETVSRGLAKNYVAHGLTTPEAIMNRYTPSSNGSWANGVGYFLEELK